MNSNNAWIFLSVAMAAGNETATLDSIFFYADFLNRGLPTHPMLQSVFGWLKHEGYLQQFEDRYGLTERGLSLFMESKRKYKTMFDAWDELSMLMPDVEHNYIDDSISEEKVKKAYRMYGKYFRKIARMSEVQKKSKRSAKSTHSPTKIKGAKGADMKDRCPDFDQAILDFQSFLSSQEWPEEVRWISTGDVLFWREKMYVRIKSEERAKAEARRIYNLGKNRKLGLAINGLFHASNVTWAYVSSPIDADASERLMYPEKDLKLSVFVNPEEPTFITNCLQWAFLYIVGDHRGTTPRNTDN